MKKRLVSTLLMGALFVTSMSVFTSCKDYDDDINSNTQLISTLQSQFDEQKKSIDSLKAQLTSDFNTATSAADAAKAAATQALAEAQKAQTAADAAATKAAAAQTAADAAKATGDEALAKAKQAEADAATAEANAQKGIADAKTAQATADAAKAAAAEAAAAAAAAKIEVLEQLNAQVAQLQAAIDGKVSKEEFDKIIATLATTDGLNAALATVNAEIAKLQEQLNATNAALEAHEADVKANMDDAKDKIAGVQGTVKAIQDKLDELYNDAVRKGDFDQAIALLTARLEGVEKNLATFKNYDDTAIRELISANADAIAANSTAISNNTTAIAANAASIAALQQTVLQIAVNTAAIEALDARVGNLEQAVQQIENLATKEALQEALVALNAAIATKANQEDVEEAIASLTAALGVVAAATDDKFADIEAVLAAIIADVDAIKAGASTSEELDQVKADIAALEAYVATLASKTDLDALQAAFEVTLEAKLANLNDNLLAVINNKVDGLLVQIDAISGISGEVQTLSGKVTDNATAIANLQTTMQVVNQLVDGLGSRISVLEGKTGQYDAYDGRISILEGKVNTLDGELAGLNSALAEIDDILQGLDDLGLSRMSSLGANASASATSLANVLKAMAGKIEDINTAVAGLQGDVTTINGKIGTLEKGVKELQTAVATLNKSIDQITLLVSKNLTSLVYRPEGEDAYLYGFPTIKARMFNDVKLYNISNRKAPKESGKDSRQFEVIAKYWLNPSNTDITKYTFSFDEVASKNWITRATNRNSEKAGISATPLGVDNHGILSVAVKIDKAAYVNDAETIYLDENGDESKSSFVRSNGSSYAWLTTIALQATRNDTKASARKDTVTSDYAVIVPDVCNEIKLANAFFDTPAANKHFEGDNKGGHLQDSYTKLESQNGTGYYTYTIAYDQTVKDGAIKKSNPTKGGYVDLKDILIHFDNGTPCGGEMSHADATAFGFKFDYLPVDENKAFVIDKENERIYLAEGAEKNVGQKLNVLVVLQDEKNTSKIYAYGYISIVISRSSADVKVNLGTLKLQCQNNGGVETFSVGYSYDQLKKDIEAAIGKSGSFANYTWDGNLTLALNKKDKKDGNTNTTKGNIHQNGAGTQLVWEFTEVQVTEAFYKDGKPNNTKNYTAWVKLTPDASHPELPVVWVEVVIEDVVYPAGKFSNDDRIERYWFSQTSKEIAPSAAERYETHANVEVVGQKNADDEFIYDISSAFMKNKFTIYGLNGYNFDNIDAVVFFNASKYDVRNGAANGTVIDNPKEVLTGASGAKYALYLNTWDDLELKAIKAVNGKFAYSADDQIIVTLTNPALPEGQYNQIATFKGWRYVEPNTDYARDLLNYAGYNYIKREVELGEKETFTTHMMLGDITNCLTIALEGNEFDIRYLRPISAKVDDPKTITDAVDNGVVINLWEITNYTDWRGYAFAPNAAGLTYLNYYGVKRLKADFSQARTNLSNSSELDTNKWPLITDITNKLKFTPDCWADESIDEGATVDAEGHDLVTYDSKGQEVAVASKTFTDPHAGRTLEQFKAQCGKYKYENNAGNVGDFEICIPVSIVYDWGETKPTPIIIKIKSTTGQSIEGARLQ